MHNKHKRARSIIAILCTSIVLLYAIAIPIGAVVNSSQVGLGQTGLYGESTFPFTIGFVQRDDTLDRNYIFATDIGGWGQNGNQTVEGDDIFYWNYPDASDEETSSIMYTQGDTVWVNDASYVDMNPSNGATGTYRGGYSSIDLQYNHISTDAPTTTESIIFKATNVYYNPLWLAEVDGAHYKFKDTAYGYSVMIPMVYLPALDDYNAQKFVGAYSVEASVIDMNGERHMISYSIPIDTDSSIVGVGGIPFIRPESLRQFINPEDIEVWTSTEVEGSNSTICIEEFRGYLDIDYYESSGGVWTKVTDSELLNKCRVTYPRYDTSGVTNPSASARTWLAYPSANKMLAGVISGQASDVIIIPEIDDDMYKDYTGWLGTAVKGFFDTPLLGGMSLGVIVGVIVMFSCAIALLKIFAGG